MSLETRLRALAGRLSAEVKTKFGNGDMVMNTNPFGGRRLYINSINNAMFRAAQRWEVTGNFYTKGTGALVGPVSASSLTNMFDGNYEGGLVIPAGQYAVVNVTFTNELNGQFPGYPYGDFIFSHYYSSFTESIAVRVYSNFATHGVGWHNLVVTDVVNNGSTALVRKANNQKYQLSQVEFTFTARDDINAQITEVDWNLERPQIAEMPLLDKFRNNTLYQTLFWKTAGVEKARIQADGRAEFTTLFSGGSTVVTTNDARLSDARTPKAHTHAAADVNSGVLATARLGTGTANSTSWLRGDGVWAALPSIVSAMDDLSDVVITSPATGNVIRFNGTNWVNSVVQQGDVSGLVTALAGKANTSHTHVAADVTDLTTTVQGIVNTQLDIAGSPATLNTLNELAAALGDDPNFATTITNQIAGKANEVHTHAIGDTTGLQAALDGKAAASHGHAIADVTGLQTALDDKAAGTHTHDDRYYTETEVNTALAGKANSSHSHGIGDLPVAASGATSSTALVRADDSRLTDARTPTSHTHTKSQISDFAHTHPVGDLTATGTKSSTTFLRGDNTWATPPDTNTTYAIPTQAEAEAGTATTARAFSAERVKQAILALSPVKSVAGKTGIVTLAKADVGLGSVDNTSDAAKPVSTAQQTALNGKANTGHTHGTGEVTGYGSFASPLTLAEQAATPSTPTSGNGLLYAKASDGLPYFKGDDGVERLLATRNVNISVAYHSRTSPTYTYEVIKVHTGRPVPGLVENLYANDYEQTWAPGNPFAPPREELTGYFKRYGHDFITDAGALLAGDGTEIVGVSIKGGVIYNDFDVSTGQQGTDAIGFRGDGTAKIYSARWGDTAASMVADGVTEAFSFGPALVVNGVAQNLESNSQWGSFNTQDSARTLLGVTQQGDIVVVLVHGETGVYGIKGNEIVNVMTRHGCYNAIMLDGGGSTCALVNGDYAHISSDATGIRPAQNVIAIRARVTNQADTGWINLTYRSGFTYGADSWRQLAARRIGERVYIRGRAVGTFPTGGWVTVADIPTELVPKYGAVGIGATNTGVSAQLSILALDTQIQVNIDATGGGNVDFGGFEYTLL